MKLALSLLLFGCGPAIADTVLATRTLRPQTVITAADVEVSEADMPGAYTLAEDVIGQEARVAIYAGRPIRIEDIGPPAIVERNEIVTLYYSKSGLMIATEGRSLQRGGVGDRVRVMNLSSRSTVTGRVLRDGRVSVTPFSAAGM